MVVHSLFCFKPSQASDQARLQIVNFRFLPPFCVSRFVGEWYVRNCRGLYGARASLRTRFGGARRLHFTRGQPDAMLRNIPELFSAGRVFVVRRIVGKTVVKVEA